MTAELTCTSGGLVTLVHGVDTTEIVDDLSGTRYYEDDGTTETLNIECLAPQAYPADTDGDGCPDMREAGLNPMAGGQRNFLNQWDYFDPTHDGLGRINDVLAVVDQYSVDEGQPGYTQNTDRTLLGPNAWNLGPPNGQQRVDDILNALRQYYHDCS